ncbi:hypothetical protein SAMD00019534_046600 [Acytostelium subglobosum LB1]|uniref:hypothetical protein n=1 Tax=Acytostelium subglobosum LB1 TaxID=1410327 RepID=UPI00064497CD|nr:hypothetical protein SAMD00019534_046600 [Acytostelium subglobosum LB1]GAM21485.1 hypothetical protein SAMD00019534_046600 [Acytostelium subglobosum LB1]|eukprot:XP_012755604.1 hypothetical protein SAMD00019534_046600 [Acytostelium subglobosum LB1]
MENEYKVYTPTNEVFLTARENASNCCLLFCANMRKFKMSIRNGEGQELLKLRRPFRCFRKGCCCCPCIESCHQDLEIFMGENTAQPGKYLGHIKERFSFCVPVLNVFDDSGQEIYRVIGEFCGCANYAMSVRQGSGTDSGWGDPGDEVGQIEKRWSGWAKELFTTADNFFINFPPNSTTYQKSLLMGALFFVDYLYFERSAEDYSS